jgi:hypothetical protein
MNHANEQASTIKLSQVVDIPGYYFNGFQIGLSNSDISMLLLNSGKPIAQLHMSYTTAKSLSVMLTDVITKLEEATNHELMTTEYIEQRLSKLATGSK